MGEYRSKPISFKNSGNKNGTYLHSSASFLALKARTLKVIHSIETIINASKQTMCFSET